MNRCLIFVLCFTAALVAVLGWFWLDAPPSNQELLANTAKALDYAEGWKSVGGPPWWSPNFLHGYSLAPSLSILGTNIWLLIWTNLAGLLAGPKIAALLCLAVATLGTYALARHLTGEPWTAAACAIAFLLSPPVYFRLIHVEHMVFVSAFALIPLVFWSLTIVLEKPSRQHGLLFGAAFAALLLTYAKAAALIFPLVVLYALVFWLWKQRTWKPPGSALLAAVIAIVILGLLPNVPALREMQLATVFELAPFEGWKNSFSLKSNILWFDRLGVLSTGMAPAFSPTTPLGSNYLGFVATFFIAAVLLLRPAGLYSSNTGFFFRLFLVLALAAHWFSFGSRSVLGGQFAFLSLANNVADPVVALSWFLLLVQAWVIMRLVPPQMPGRQLVGAVLIALYLLVPGFRLISWLPVYSDLRAPHDFSQVGGVFFLALATGCAVRLSTMILPTRIPRTALALGACVVAAIDVSPFFRPFFQSPLSHDTFHDFQEAGRFLSQAPKPGWVYPLSGRYFYLLTPYFSKRGLTTEAFNSYLMQRGVAYLQTTAQLSPEFLRAYLNVAGVAYVLIDKKDPDSPAELQERFKSLLTAAYENEHFLVLENSASHAPAFLARNFVSGTAEPALVAQSGLSLEKLDVIVLPPAPETYATQPGKVGTINEKGHVLEEKLTPDNKQPFLPLAFADPRWKNYQEIVLLPPAQSGWVVVPEAFHPDWKAFSAEKSLPVLAVDGAFLGVRVDQPHQPLTLRFTPPWWYNGFLVLSALGWLGLGFLATVPLLSFAPARLKNWLRERPGLDRGPAALADFSRGPIRRALVVIPTYNEAKSLPGMLEKVLAVDGRVEVLVVDDNSPDGTASLVKNHPAFGGKLHLLARSGKLGLGSAYREGFHWAFERDYDACLEMDADLSHDPADVPRLLQALDDGADAAIGSRYLGGVRVMNWSEHRLFLSTGASRFVRIVTGLPLTDATSGFKAVRTSVLRSFNWKQFRAEGYGFQVELHHALWQAGARLIEVPIVFTERRDGETKMTLGIAIEAAWHTIRLSLTNK